MSHPNRRGLQLHYGLGDADLAVPAEAPALDHPMFDVLVAVDRHGSIKLAAQALGLSYRHVWGHLKAWEQDLGAPLVGWAQGTPAHLTPFAERLVAAERRARARIAPHLDAMRAELRHVLAHALDERPAVLRVAAVDDAAVPPPHLVAGLAELASSRHQLHLVFELAGDPEAQAWWHPADREASGGDGTWLPSHRVDGRDWRISPRPDEAGSPAWLRLQDVLESSAWARLAAADQDS